LNGREGESSVAKRLSNCSISAFWAGINWIGGSCFFGAGGDFRARLFDGLIDVLPNDLVKFPGSSDVLLDGRHLALHDIASDVLAILAELVILIGAVYRIEA
jgi:hypothetical protein